MMVVAVAVRDIVHLQLPIAHEEANPTKISVDG
jgi:hypothetical protein